MVSNVDPEHNIVGKHVLQEKFDFCKSLDDDENSQYTANIINDFLTQAHEVLNNHEINKKRKLRGLLPANFIFTRGAGIENPTKNPVSQVIIPAQIAWRIFTKGISKVEAKSKITITGKEEYGK